EPGLGGPLGEGRMHDFALAVEHRGALAGCEPGLGGVGLTGAMTGRHGPHSRRPPPTHGPRPDPRPWRQLHLAPAGRRGPRHGAGGSGRGRPGVRRRRRGRLGTGGDPADPPPRRPRGRRAGPAGALATARGHRPGRRPHSARHPPRGRRRPGRGRRPRLRCAGGARPYRDPHRIPRPRRLVLRRHPLQSRLRPPVRGHPGPDAGLARPAGGPARRHPGVLRARVHAVERRLRPGGRPRQPGAPAPQRRGGRHARQVPAHAPGDARERARLQSVPAHRCARRPRRRLRLGRRARAAAGRGLRRAAALEGRVPRMSARMVAALAMLLAAAPAWAAAAAADGPFAVTVEAADEAGGEAPPEAAAVPAPAGPVRGTEIYERFVGGLAQRECESASPRWRAHFAHVPGQLAAGDGDVLPLFGYVVDALRARHLPTEYALIPFVESGYRPGARSSGGPAGLWQFIAVTARNHDIPVRPGYDGRLSPVDATRAAVRYLRTLHGMFAGDWRLAVMAFNAGEYRVLGALRRHGQRPANADPESLESL